MRGYGDSEKPEGRTYYRLKYLVEDVKNLIEALGKMTGVGPVNWVGKGGSIYDLPVMSKCILTKGI